MSCAQHDDECPCDECVHIDQIVEIARAALTLDDDTQLRFAYTYARCDWYEA